MPNSAISDTLELRGREITTLMQISNFMFLEKSKKTRNPKKFLKVLPLMWTSFPDKGWYMFCFLPLQPCLILFVYRIARLCQVLWRKYRELIYRWTWMHSFLKILINPPHIQFSAKNLCQIGNFIYLNQRFPWSAIKSIFGTNLVHI